MRPLIVLALSARLAVAADCPPGQAQASCALHDEGVTAFTAGNYDEAATKFRAAIAAGATARSYLGYAQSVEGQGKVALAYEAMLIAQKLSNEEMARPGGAQDTGIVGRAERIKYKLAELGAQIAYAWLRLPDGVDARRLVSVYREGEGDLARPIGRWIVVAPGRQVMFATLDDGQRLQLIAQVAPGGQGTVMIPVPAPRPAIQQMQPQAYRPVYIEPPPPAPSGPARNLLAIDIAFVMMGDEDVGIGIGFAAQFERGISKRLAVVARGALLFHPSQSDMPELDSGATSETEGLILAGARTRSKLPLYASVEAGALIYSRGDEYQHTYPALLVGGGVRLGKMHFELYSLLAVPTGDRDLPTRLYIGFGFDLLRN